MKRSLLQQTWSAISWRVNMCLAVKSLSLPMHGSDRHQLHALLDTAIKNLKHQYAAQKSMLEAQKRVLKSFTKG